MRTTNIKHRFFLALALLLVCLPLASTLQAQSTPTSANGLLYARPFQVEQPFPYRWNADQSTINSGWILVLEVNPELVKPRQVAEPVLFVGSDTAQKINTGYEDGRLIVLVPGDLALDGTRIWFGTPQLPEAVDNTAKSMEIQRATNANLPSFTREQIQTATELGGQTLEAKDEWALMAALESLTARFAPLETKANQR